MDAMQCLLTVGFMVHLSGLIGFSHGLSLCKLRVYQMCMGCVNYSNGAMTRLGRLRVVFWGGLNQVVKRAHWQFMGVLLLLP